MRAGLLREGDHGLGRPSTILAGRGREDRPATNLGAKSDLTADPARKLANVPLASDTAIAELCNKDTASAGRKNRVSGS